MFVGAVATLAGSSADPIRAADKVPTASDLPALPEPISSFGAAVVDGRLYVYGGHTGEAHAHSRKNLSQRFQRLRLDSPTDWEALPGGPALQGLPLVAHGKSLYRVGGLSVLNEPGESENLVSVADFARFDSSTKRWTTLRPLPQGRSSHDAVVGADGKLYVVGGWALGGTTDKAWASQSLVIDLAHPAAEWKSLPEQPFQRRALAAAYHDGKVYAIGGMTPKGPSLDVHYFDVESGRWSTGPAVPRGRADVGPTGMSTDGMNGFGCSACTVGGKLYLSTMDGSVYVLSADGKAWEYLGALQTPRFFHRLVPDDHGALLAVAGASKRGHLASIERFSLPASRR